MNDKKRVLKEFEWFQVQTKVREIISQIIQPLEKRLLGNSNSITRLQQSVNEEKDKMEQLTLMINNDEDIFKRGIFKNIEDKFQKQTIHIKELQNKIQYLENYINSKAQVLDKRLQESTEVLNRITNFKDYVQDEFNNQSKKIIDSYTNVFENFDTINQEISSLQVDIKALKVNHEVSIKKIEGNQAIVKQANDHLHNKLNEFYQSIKQIKAATQINDAHVIHMREQILKMAAYEKILSKFQSLVNQQIIRTDNLEFKIEVIQPVVSFTQINEYAHHILPQKYHKNISIYYYNRYNQLIEEILNNNFDQRRITETAKGNLQLIKQAHKRAIKLVFKEKKDILLKKGIDLQSLSHQKKEEQLASIHLQQDFQGLDEADLQSKKKVVTQSDAPKIAKQQIEALTKQLKEKIELQLTDSKKYIQSMEYLLKRDQENLDKRYDQLSATLNQLSLNFHLEQKLHKQFYSGMDSNLTLLGEELKNMKLVIRQMHDIMLVFNEIEKQDEIDRQGIALIGIRQKHRDEIRDAYDKKINRAVAGLDEECLSCSGNPNYYNEFFKMACLTYSSSPIHYDNRKYERVEILDRLHQQLQLIHHVLSDKPTKSEQLCLQTERKSVRVDKINQSEPSSSSRIMNVPSKDPSSMTDRYVIRNVSSSQQMRARFNSKSPEQPRIINPSELTSQLLARTHNRLFNRKLQRAMRDSKPKKEESKGSRSEYMRHLSRHFKELNKQNQSFVNL